MSNCCGTIYAVDIPGPEGGAGAPGAPGADGISAFTTVQNYAPSAQPLMPHPVQHISGTITSGSSTVTFADTSTIFAGMTVEASGIPSGSTVISVDSATDITISSLAIASGVRDVRFTQSVTINTTSSTAWMVVGEVVIAASWGYMIVASIPTDSSVVLMNPADVTLGLYQNNVVFGTPLAAGKKLVPSGMQGPSGAVPSGALLAVNNLNDVIDPAVSFANIGGGTAGTFDQGNANGLIPRVDDASGLTNGEVVFATAAGVESKRLASTLSAIGAQPLDVFLTSIAALGTVADKTIYTTGVNAAAETTLTAYIRTLLAAVDAATARAILGVVASGSLDYMFYQQQSVSGFDGVVCALGAWNTAPVNTEVVDEGNHGTLASNTVTLPAGTYRYAFRGVTANCGLFQARLFNATTLAVVTNGYGQSAGASAGVNLSSFGEGVFTIAVPNGFRIEIFCSGTGTFGLASNTGGPEIYSSMAFWKES